MSGPRRQADLEVILDSAAYDVIPSGCAQQAPITKATSVKSCWHTSGTSINGLQERKDGSHCMVSGLLQVL
jgi:hypothetical protein